MHRMDLATLVSNAADIAVPMAVAVGGSRALIAYIQTRPAMFRAKTERLLAEKAGRRRQR